MSYKLRDLRSTDQFSFSTEIEAILKYLKKSWDIKALPKGYKEFKKNYQDYQGMEELDEAQLLKKFKGHGDGGTCSPPFVTRVSLPHVVYDDTNQGRRPLETLLGAVLGHGMILGQRIAALDHMSTANKRLRRASHCVSMARYEEDPDPVVTALWHKELEEHFDDSKLGNDPYEISKKYEELRKQASEAKLGEKFKTYLKEKGGKVILRNKSKGIEHEYWTALFNLSLILWGKKFEEHMNQAGLIVKLSKPSVPNAINYIVTLKEGV
jgi:hypothetical protein